MHLRYLPFNIKVLCKTCIINITRQLLNSIWHLLDVCLFSVGPFSFGIMFFMTCWFILFIMEWVKSIWTFKSFWYLDLKWQYVQDRISSSSFNGSSSFLLAFQSLSLSESFSTSKSPSSLTYCLRLGFGLGICTDHVWQSIINKASSV